MRKIKTFLKEMPLLSVEVSSMISFGIMLIMLPVILPFIGDFHYPLREDFSYTVTDKFGLHKDSSASEDETPSLTIRNNETKKVYSIEVTKEIYYQMAITESFDATESKDGKSINIKFNDKTETYALKEIK